MSEKEFAKALHEAGGCYCRECRRCDGFPGPEIELGEVGICKPTGFTVHADDWCKWSKLREARGDDQETV